MTITAQPAEKQPGVRESTSARKAPKSLADRLEASPGRYLLIFTLVYLVAAISNNVRRDLWIDELFTSYLADLPSISQIWPQLAKGIELNPPLPFWLTWMVHHTIGKGEVISRLPSTIGFWVMCLCVFQFVRRRSDAVHGFMALLLPLFTYTFTDATFARGYGLLLGASAAAVLCWQLAADGVKKPWSTLGLAFAVAFAVSCHYYGAYIPVALGAGELIRAKQRKRLDWAVAGALLAGVAPLLGYVPLIRMAKSGLAAFWAPPLAEFLYQTYVDLLGPVMIIVFAFLLLTLGGARDAHDEERWRPASLKMHELAVCTLLLAMPVVVYAAALLDKAAFYPRYVQPVVVGFAIVVPLFAYRIGGGNAWFRRTAIELLVGFCLGPWCLWQAIKLTFPPPQGGGFIGKINTSVSPELPLVIDSDSDFMSMFYYAKPELRERLFTLDDAAASVRYRGSDTGMRSLEVGQTFRDLHVVDYHKFVAAHGEFLVLRTRPTSWIVQALMADGAAVELADYRKAPSTFAEEALLFRVRVGGKAAPAVKPSPGSADSDNRER